MVSGEIEQTSLAAIGDAILIHACSEFSTFQKALVYRNNIYARLFEAHATFSRKKYLSLKGIGFRFRAATLGPHELIRGHSL